ncbi:MAG: LptF/LptG family permease [Balneolaceae bacterium]|nr:LptF/LptG family permease [Balneolaceae bacterium]
MINSVQKDLLKKHVGPFLFCFFTMMFILLMQFLMLHVDKLVGKGLPLMIVLELIITNLAYMVVLAVPVAILVSSLMAFGKFSEWNELTAIRAAGINPFQLILPVFIVGVLLFGFTAYFSNLVLPDANHKARSLFLDIRMQKPAFDLQEGTFYQDLEGYTFLIKEIDAETDSLIDVRVFQAESDGRDRAVVSAKRGWLDSPDQFTLSLFLENGSILRYLPGDRRDDETIERTFFDRYRMSFDLSDLAFSRSNPDQRSRTDRTMSTGAMLAVVDSLKRERESEYNKFSESISESVEIPIKTDIGRTLTLSDTEKLDTLSVYESEFMSINELYSPTLQINALNRTINAFDSYRADLDRYYTNNNWRSFKIAELLVEVHKKFSIPFACILFVLLAAPIGMLTRNGNIGVAALISSGILTLFFISIIQGEKLADRLLISPIAGMWSINALLLISGIFLMLRVSTSFRLTNLWNRDQ